MQALIAAERDGIVKSLRKLLELYNVRLQKVQNELWDFRDPVPINPMEEEEESEDLIPNAVYTEHLLELEKKQKNLQHLIAHCEAKLMERLAQIHRQIN